MGAAMDEEFIFDPEYENYVPRTTQLKADSLGIGDVGDMGCAMLLSIFYLPVSIILIVAGLQWFSEDYLFLTDSIQTTATVTQCNDDYTRNSSEPNLYYTYNVDGVEHDGTYIFPGRDYKCTDFRPGATLAAIYLRNNPAKIRITDASANHPYSYNIFLYLVLIGVV